MGLAILTAAALGFLGLGAQEPTFATVFAFNVLGDGLRDALDPRMRDA
jgi:ABC-type dipeptide/oligopeptide/nickel transport system permease subunit